jgi:hypothetical protein
MGHPNTRKTGERGKPADTGKVKEDARQVHITRRSTPSWDAGLEFPYGIVFCLHSFR